MRSLERTLIAESVARVRNLHTFVQINARSLKAFEQDESASAGLAQIDSVFAKLSELSQLEEAAQAAIALGSITMFRHHLRLALSSAVSHSLYSTTLAAVVQCTASSSPGGDKLGPLEAFAHDFGFSAPGWPVDFALKEALTADLGPLSAGVLSKGEWQYAAFGLASLFCASAMHGDYSSQQVWKDATYDVLVSTPASSPLWGALYLQCKDLSASLTLALGNRMLYGTTRTAFRTP